MLACLLLHLTTSSQDTSHLTVTLMSGCCVSCLEQLRQSRSLMPTSSNAMRTTCTCKPRHPIESTCTCTSARGVFWDKKTRRWRCQLGYQSKKIFLGYFDDAGEAAKAYDTKLVELRGAAGMRMVYGLPGL